MKFLHMADCHLDAPFVELGQTLNKANARRRELKQTFSKAIELGKKQGVDVIFISGDLFEHVYVDKSTIQFVNDLFMQIPKIKIFISPGNHDPLLCNSYYNTFDWVENVHIFKGQLEKIYLPQLNANIWGVGFENFYVTRCLVRLFEDLEKDKINVLITHGTLDIQKEYKYHPLDSKYISSIGFDYCALGHMHKCMIDEENGICYPGSPEPLGFDELGEHGVILGEITKHYRAINFYPIALRQYHVKEVDVTGSLTNEEVIEDIKFSFNVDTYKNDFIKINLIGQIEPSIIDLEAIEDYFKNDFYFIKVEDNTIAPYPFEEMAKEYTIKGLFVKRMKELIDKANDEDKRMLIKALQYGVDALSNREIRL